METAGQGQGLDDGLSQPSWDTCLQILGHPGEDARHVGSGTMMVRTNKPGFCAFGKTCASPVGSELVVQGLCSRSTSATRGAPRQCRPVEFTTKAWGTLALMDYTLPSSSQFA